MLPPDYIGRPYYRDADLHDIVDERKPARGKQSKDGPIEPFVTYDPMCKTHDLAPRATLIDIARDPRFIEANPPRPGLRIRLGRALIALGWLIAHGDRATR